MHSLPCPHIHNCFQFANVVFPFFSVSLKELQYNNITTPSSGSLKELQYNHTSNLAPSSTCTFIHTHTLSGLLPFSHMLKMSLFLIGLSQRSSSLEAPVWNSTKKDIFTCSGVTLSNIETDFLRQDSRGFSYSVWGLRWTGCVQIHNSICSKCRQYWWTQLLLTWGWSLHFSSFGSRCMCSIKDQHDLAWFCKEVRGS